MCSASSHGSSTWPNITVDVERGIVYSVENIPSWHEVSLKNAFEERYRRPAVINNDANAFAVGELHFGRGPKLRRFSAELD